MLRTIRRSTLAALLALGLLIAPALPAAAAPAEGGWLADLLQALTSRLGFTAAASGSTGETYPELDPDGLTVPSPQRAGAASEGEALPEIDPNGLTAAPPSDPSSAEGETFPHLDPNG